MDEFFIRVGLWFEVIRLERFDEINGELKFFFFIFMLWSDKCLKWDIDIIVIL